MKKELIIKKVNYYKYQVLAKRKFIDKKIDNIFKYSSICNIDYSDLYGILLIEYVNRGYWVNRLLERFLVILMPNIVVKHDLSIGLAQVKISTAKQFYQDLDDKIIARKLLNEEFNIHLCAQIIENYYISPLKKNELLGLVKKYTTGDKNSRENVSINIYYRLMKWIKGELLI